MVKVLDCTTSLQKAFRRLQLTAWLQAAAALSLSSLLPSMPAGGSRILLLLLLTAYLARKVRQAFRAYRSAKQLRLEERFLMQHLAPGQLRQCLERGDHLWAHSVILQGLRAILARPLPRLLSTREKKRRMGLQYHRAFAGLQAPLIHADLLLALLLVTFGGAILPAYDPGSQLLPPQPVLLAGLFALFTEVAQAALHKRIRRLFKRLARALSDWTLNGNFERALPESPKTYMHHLLYQAHPWFTAAVHAWPPPRPAEPPNPVA